VGNAVKFTDYGEIIISVEYEALSDDRAHIRLSVEDTGFGISENDIKCLFDRFEQVDSSSTRGKGGAGLGLAISQELAMLMGTLIEVKSELGKGSCFWIDLDVDIASPDSRALETEVLESDKKPLDEDHGKQLKILIAEDNSVNQMLIKKLVSKRNWQSILASNGKEACDLAANEKFDLILMDIQMPVMTGLEAAQIIRASGGINNMVPIIAVTANCMPEDIESYKSAGMQDVIGKPLKFDQFYSIVEGQAYLTRSQNKGLG
jgi:CheY-like chemotaxis protein